MSEKLKSQKSSSGWESLQAPVEQAEAEQVPSFPEDPDQYTEAELRADPAKRFHVNPEDFKIFSKQAEMGPNWRDPAETLPLDETMGRFVKSTADAIAVIAGESSNNRSNEAPPAADHVIYLDKSARPVSWMVNVFWDAFTEKKRPAHSYLAIDRMEWFARTDTPVDATGYIKEADGKTARVARFEDFRKENVSAEDIARIRALYIPGGIENEDVDEIMNTPTGLEGKNITIIDEVGRSGSTLKIAQYLVSRAIPEAASVNGYTYWNGGSQIGPDGESQMRSVPVWYDAQVNTGRGIGDVDEQFFARRYEKTPNKKTHAQSYAAFVLGSYLNLEKEPGQPSRKLAKEIKKMREEWDKGHILMPLPDHYDEDKWADHIEEQGIVFGQDPTGRQKNVYINIQKDIHSRPPVPPHSS